MIDQSNPLIIGSVPFLQLNKEYKKNLESLCLEGETAVVCSVPILPLNKEYKKILNRYA